MSGALVVPFCNRGTLKREYRNTNIGDIADKLGKNIYKANLNARNYSYLGVLKEDVTLYDGFIVPGYSRCIYISQSTSSDGALIAIDYNGKLYIAFRASGTWGKGRTL